MPTIPVQGRRPAYVNAPKVPSTAARPPAAAFTGQPGLQVGSFATDENENQTSQVLNHSKTRRLPQAQAELRSQAKRLKIDTKATSPYVSKNGFPGVALNCQVRVKDVESPGSEDLIVGCRHLATTFAQHTGKKREVMQTFSTREGIAATYDGKLIETDENFSIAIRDAPPGCKHVVSSEQLGGYIGAVASQLDPAHRSGRGPSQANCLLLTVDHAMALHVESKSKFGVEYVVAKLYDPNDTANYRRVVRASPQDFDNLKLKDMMIRPQLIGHYGGRQNKPLLMVAVSMDHRVQPPINRSAARPSAEHMHLALRDGVLDDMHAMFDAAFSQDKTPEARFELLKANSSEDGVDTPGLFRALQDGHCSTVKAFAQGVLASSLSPEAKVELLAAKLGGDGVPGLFEALANNHFDTVQAFAQELLASSLSQQAKVDLLAAKDGDGFSGLRVALFAGRSDAVKAFAHEVLTSNLGQVAKVDLLAAKDGGGTPGLCGALQTGQSDVVSAFVHEVLASDLGQEAKVDLLAAKLSNGVSGLSLAHYNQHHETVNAFTQAVMQSSLSDDQKAELLHRPF